MKGGSVAAAPATLRLEELMKNLKFNQTTIEPLQMPAKQSKMATCVALGGGAFRARR